MTKISDFENQYFVSEGLFEPQLMVAKVINTRIKDNVHIRTFFLILPPKIVLFGVFHLEFYYITLFFLIQVLFVIFHIAKIRMIKRVVLTVIYHLRLVPRRPVTFDLCRSSLRQIKLKAVLSKTAFFQSVFILQAMFLYYCPTLRQRTPR